MIAIDSLDKEGDIITFIIVNLTGSTCKGQYFMVTDFTEFI